MDSITLHGVRIVCSPDRPRMQLSDDVPVSEDFRAEMNAWLLDFFGTWNMVPEGKMLLIAGMQLPLQDSYFVTPRTLQALKRAADAGLR